MSAATGSLRKGYGLVEQTADMVAMFGRTLLACVTPPFTWREDFVEEFWLGVRRGLVPVMATSIAIGLSAATLQAGVLLAVLGTPDRTSGFLVMASIREFAVWTTSMVVGGIVGSGICADIGARRVRNELDAMAVMGIDIERAIIVPRFLALGVLTFLMAVIGAISGLLGALVGQLLAFQEPLSSFGASLFANLTVAEVMALLVKTVLIGFIIALANCYKGLTASGGAEGVGRAVNQAVVIAFILIWVFSLLFTGIYLAAYPDAINPH